MKPPGAGSAGVIGWHTDREHWPFWDGEAFSIWLAIDDVPESSGPVQYVVGSHRWPDSERKGDAHARDLDTCEMKMKADTNERTRDWHKVPAVLRAGGVGLHSADTVHGSGPNETKRPRIGLVINVRSAQTRLRPGIEHHGYGAFLDHPVVCPLIYRQGSES